MPHDRQRKWRSSCSNLGGITPEKTAHQPAEWRREAGELAENSERASSTPVTQMAVRFLENLFAAGSLLYFLCWPNRVYMYFIMAISFVPVKEYKTGVRCYVFVIPGLCFIQWSHQCLCKAFLNAFLSAFWTVQNKVKKVQRQKLVFIFCCMCASKMAFNPSSK